MKTEELPYGQLLFVCTTARAEGERISCAGAHRCGQAILDGLKAYIKENNLESVARAAKSGCHEKCEMGPNVVVMPQNHFLTGLTEADLPRVIQTYLAPLTVRSR